MGSIERKFASDSDFRTDRRTALGTGAAAILGVAGMVAVGKPIFAQDATPSASLAAEAAASPEASSLPTIPPEVEEFAHDWPMYGADYAQTRVSTGSTIDSSNVSELGVAWELNIDANAPFGAITSNPVVLGDRVYIIDNQSAIQCVDRESGEVVWATVENQPTVGPNGLAVGYGYVIGVTGDSAEVYALDMESGEEQWRVRLTYGVSEGITIAPVIYDGNVIVSTVPGNTGEFYSGGARGIIYCMRITDGRVIWSFDTVQDNLWDNFAVNSGGGLWYPPSIDVETGVIFAGVGNAAPYPGTDEFPSGSSRPGENNYANCLIAIDPAQGKLLWYLNVKPRDYYDHDNQITPVLGTIMQGESEADVVFTAGKHGYVAAVHRASGHEIWRRAVGKHQNDGMLDLPEEPIEVYPGIQGGVGAPMAFKDGVLYVAVLNWPNMVSATEATADFGALSSATTEMIALDGATGEYLWNTELPSGTNGPGPTIANDVVFIGTLDGIARGFNIADGTEVWRSQTSAGLNAPFAIAGDMLLVPGGSFIAASSDSPDPLPGINTSVIAYKLGATGEVFMAEPGATPEAAEEDTDTLKHVSAVDIAFEPVELTINADTDVTILLTNNGNLQHDLIIEDTDFATDLLNAGDSQEIVVNLPLGTYVYYCSVFGHREAGMQGTLTVVGKV